MLKTAYISRGMGDCLNARDFLIAYCKQKNINQKEINVYTIHKEIFEDTNFIIKNADECNLEKLVCYANFGHFNLQKKYYSLKLDKCISLNAGINYCFDDIVKLNWSADISNIDLPEKFVTVNYGCDKISNPELICKKLWLMDYWEKLVKNIGIDTVQIGAGQNTKNIKGVTLNLVNKLSLKQSAEVMKKALFHIDIEGGLVILGQHIGVKSVVLFTATNLEQFARKGNLNIRNTSCYACCGSLNTKEQKNMPLYVKKLNCDLRCSKDLTPEYVLEEIKYNGWL